MNRECEYCGDLASYVVTDHVSLEYRCDECLINPLAIIPLDWLDDDGRFVLTNESTRPQQPNRLQAMTCEDCEGLATHVVIDYEYMDFFCDQHIPRQVVYPLDLVKDDGRLFSVDRIVDDDRLITSLGWTRR